MSKEFTLKEVSKHVSKEDLYVVIHDKVYGVSSFLDHHPGGGDVIIDNGGQDVTETFEELGHSDEARELMEGLLVGTLKREDRVPAVATTKTSPALKTVGSATKPAKSFDISILLYLFSIIGSAVALGLYKYA